MGHKKRAPQPFVPPPAPASPPDDSPESVKAVDAAKAECEKALLALRRGNHTKALRIMKDACVRYDSSPLLHRVHSTVHVKVAALLDDPPAKLRHLRFGIESAQRAVVLSPDSIEFAHFHANLLFEAANDSKSYEEVVQECERALAIPDPADPARDGLQDEGQHKIPTTEGRIAHVQQELRSLIQKSNIASISAWMKNLSGPGEEKFRVIPMRRLAAPEDPMELRLVPATRRPNEIKKATKTPEERRKEIEVRVAAARLLQQKPTSPQQQPPQQDDDATGCSPSLPSSSGSQRLAERRKQLNQKKRVSVSSFTERMEHIRTYWSSMSEERKREFFEVSVDELRAYVMSSKDSRAQDCLSEALLFVVSNRTWRSWVCFKCGEKFVNAESHLLHVECKHIGSLTPMSQSMLPQEVDGEWAEMLVNISFWKPVDVAAVEKMFGNALSMDKLVRMDCDGSENGGNGDECLSDYWSSRDISDPSSSHQVLESKVNEHGHYNGLKDRKFTDVITQCSFRESDDVQRRWPLTDDSERTKLLEKIHGIFQVLVKHKCLSAGHLNKVIQFTMDEIQGFSFASQVVNLAIDHSPLCICFLGSSSLRKILKFLQDLCHSCGLSRYLERNILPDDPQNVAEVNEYLENISLSPDSSTLCLDSRLFLKKTTEETMETSRLDDGIEMVDAHALVSWLFTGPPCSEQLTTWSQLKEDKLQQALEFFRMLDKEFYLLKSTCERKCEHISYEEALHVVQNLCVEEQSRREQGMDFVAKGYTAVLKKRQEELIEWENDSLTVTGRFELDAISSILKEANALNANQFGYDEPLSSATSRLCDLECAEEDDWKTQDCWHQADTCIDVTIQRQKEQITVELGKIDAKILRSLGGVQQVEHKLGSSSLLDYRGIVLPLMKSFMRTHIEDLVDKDATEKSDAAREAFLAELERDAEKSKAKGGDNSKHSQEKSRDKKKNKDSKRNKDMKFSSVLTCNGGSSFEEMGEKLSVETDTDYMEPELLCSDDFLKQQEELRKKNELEEEERKLEETLEYQRRVENEAKQRHLEEQQRRSDRMVSESPSPSERHSSMLDVSPRFLENGKESPEAIIRKKQSTRSAAGRSPKQIESATRNVEVPAGENGSTILRHLHDEHDEEERFQADLKKAVSQSLDAFQAQQMFAVKSRTLLDEVPSLDIMDRSESKDLNIDTIANDALGAGLQNGAGEYNCFLNVIIQSLWHLRRFRDEFMHSSCRHVHIGNPCVLCALYEIFDALNAASVEIQREPVAPTNLRSALSNLYPDSNFFQEAQMNDASEVLAVIFDCLHQSFTSQSGKCCNHYQEENGIGHWDCIDSNCVAHSFFGMDIYEKMSCRSCGTESRQFKYTSFFHNVNANALRTMKSTNSESSFDELLGLVEMNHQLACDIEAGGCGKPNYIHHMLSTPPQIFTTVLGWQNTCENVEAITATLSALSTQVDVGVLYQGLDRGNKHSLASVVCYYGQHYHCFAYNHEHEEWIMYDDNTVKKIGDWSDVVSMCVRGHLQPQVLMFE